MPELPDVETFKRYADSTALNQPIASVHVEANDLLEQTSPSGLGRQLHGRCLTTTRRHGKFLFVRADDDGWLVLHFGMTGRLEYGTSTSPDRTPELRIQFENGYRLDYIAPRRLGRIAFTKDPGEYIAAQDLGPDALTLSFEAFQERATGKRGSVKCWLMNQSALAGIGNVYSDEILFQTRLYPKTDLRQLEHEDLHTLYRALQEVLHTASRNQARPDHMPDTYLLPRRNSRSRCPRCGGRLDSLKACGRTAWYCPQCQRRKN